MSAGTRWPRRGEIWWAFTPGQPDDPHQPRPVLVLSVDARNRATDDLIVIPIFSIGRLGPTRVPITAGVGGVAHDSVLFCEEITTIDRDYLDTGPLGPLVPESLLAQVLLAVHHALVPWAHGDGGSQHIPLATITVLPALLRMQPGRSLTARPRVHSLPRRSRTYPTDRARSS